ncbi:MAG: flagellar hook-associated protein FlgK [Deltaproteobacteria bacterium]|nr:flagellar hook-associated protein FlgK [Deltaproteobacteria bacterium]
MSGLFSQLYLGTNAISAQRTGIAAASHNIANVNTPGHNRVDADFRAQSGQLQGVRATGFSSSADAILSSRERLADAEMGRSEDLATAAISLEGELAASGGNLVDAIAALFGGIIELSSNPSDVALREAALSNAQAVGVAFNRSAQSIVDAQQGADDRLATLADQASSLAAEIAAANRELSQDPNPSVADRRDQAARELAELVGGTAQVVPNGSMRVTLEDGSVLVDQDRAAHFETTVDTTNYGGHLRLDVVSASGRRDVTGAVTTGRVGAQLQFRDVTSKQMLQDMDQLAFDLATQINATHRNYSGMDGVSGRDLFVPPTGVQGSALAFAVDPQMVADPARLAGSNPALGSGDNSGLLALADLRSAAVAGGGSRTFLDEGLRMQTSLGFTVQRAEKDQDIAQLRSDSLAALRDSVSGVSVEEELTKLQAFQRATEASVRVIQTVDSLLGNLIESV